jgi:hypothetical protein
MMPMKILNSPPKDQPKETATDHDKQQSLNIYLVY